MQALVLHPTAAGTAFAAAAVAAGAPLFSHGLRALRLRRRFRTLRESALGDLPSGLVHVRGRVGLESPLFGPLSGRPCAGFRLEVASERLPGPRGIDEWRPFRLTDGVVNALVDGPVARWDLAPTATLDVAPAQPLTANLRALLDRVPEALWLRRAGLALRLTERALPAGAACHVVGFATVNAAAARAASASIARTGTDDLAIEVEGATAASEPDLWLGLDDHLDFLLVSDAAPRAARLHVPALALAGLVLGPAISLAGMLYLANAADWLRTRGGF